MYIFEEFDGKHVKITADHMRYNSRFLADSQEAASKVVADLNRPLILAQLAEYRFEVETSGITLGDQIVLTDRESQAQLTGAMSSLRDELITTTRWKGPNGFVQVTLETIKPIAQAVAVHVSTCFEVEATLTEELEGIVDHEVMVDYNVRQAFDDLYRPPTGEMEVDDGGDDA